MSGDEKRERPHTQLLSFLSWHRAVFPVRRLVVAHVVPSVSAVSVSAAKTADHSVPPPLQNGPACAGLRFGTCLATDNNESSHIRSCSRFLCWHRAIFPVRRQTSIVATDELNFRVRNGNGWTLTVIDTNFGDPCGNRTHVWGVRGPRLNLLTNGPSSEPVSLIPLPPPALRPSSEAPYRSTAPPLQNEPPSLGFILNTKNSGISLFLKGGAYRALQAGTPSGTRTLDTLIKSQVLYQLS